MELHHRSGQRIDAPKEFLCGLVDFGRCHASLLLLAAIAITDEGDHR